MIREIHNGVRGRVRYKVAGLYRSPILKRRLEMLAEQNAEVNHVSASILTGDVLVLFNPDCNPRMIASLLEKVTVDCVREVDAASNGDCSSRNAEFRMAQSGVV